ncbi:MAG: acyl carrier protein [Kiritimatiellia bacterium]
MTPNDILAQLKTLMASVSPAPVDWPAVTLETPIRSLGLDSLSIMDLAYDLSQHFHVEFDLMNAGPIHTVGDVVRLIQRLQPA